MGRSPARDEYASSESCLCMADRMDATTTTTSSSCRILRQCDDGLQSRTGSFFVLFFWDPSPRRRRGGRGGVWCPSHPTSSILCPSSTSSALFVSGGPFCFHVIRHTIRGWGEQEWDARGG